MLAIKATLDYWPLPSAITTKISDQNLCRVDIYTQHAGGTGRACWHSTTHSFLMVAERGIPALLAPIY